MWISKWRVAFGEHRNREDVAWSQVLGEIKVPMIIRCRGLRVTVEAATLTQFGLDGVPLKEVIANGHNLRAGDDTAGCVEDSPCYKGDRSASEKESGTTLNGRRITRKGEGRTPGPDCFRQWDPTA